jgi:hypothetical protein
MPWSKEKLKEYMKKKYHEDSDYREKVKKKSRERQRKNYYDKNLRPYRQKLRAEILELLGNKCNNSGCLIPGGCKDIRCLEIDHVKNNGYLHRKKFGGVRLNYTSYLIEIRNAILHGSKDYQLLCSNCNKIKEFERMEIKRKQRFL